MLTDIVSMPAPILHPQIDCADNHCFGYHASDVNGVSDVPTTAVEVPMVLHTSDDERLEALAKLPSRAARVAILCHPHPLHAGTMHSSVIATCARELNKAFADNIATLRFNYRGVGESTGVYADGKGETLDVISAVDAMLSIYPNAAVDLIGYSFGSWVCLKAAWMHPRVERLCLVAPAPRILPYEERPDECRRPLITQVVVGDCDDFVTVSEARCLSRYLGATMQLIEGSDHFFHGYLASVAASVVKFVRARWTSESTANA